MPAIDAGSTARIAPAAAVVPAPAPQATAARADVRSIDVTSEPANDKERRERCADLLQEATLRRLSAPESAFFRKECR
jgi:hypothetical protein